MRKLMTMPNIQVTILEAREYLQLRWAKELKSYHKGWKKMSLKSRDWMRRKKSSRSGRRAYSL
jgi:hypothetical protein